MQLPEKAFWFLLVGYGSSVSIGIAVRMMYAASALMLSTLPACFALTIVFIGCGFYNRIDVLTKLWRALLIWIYFPLCVAVAYFDCAMGIDEGLIRYSHLRFSWDTMFAILISLLLLAGATYLTVSYLRAVEDCEDISVRTYWGKSLLLQLVLAPLLMFALWQSR